MAGRGRGFKPKFQSDILTQLSNIQGPRSASNNFEDVPPKVICDVPQTSAPTTIPSPVNNAKYENLITTISKLNSDDDGILFNQKLQYISEVWQKICETEESVIEALDVTHRRGLYDAAFATKLVNMMSSLSFNSLEIHNIKIRNQFISKLQHDFENCKALQSKSPIAFRNAVRMLGEFYHKARLTSGKPIKFFALPLKNYLEMLLESGQEEDLELFTIQLYMNGNGIRANLPQNLTDILLRVRVVLVTNDKLTTVSKLWLLLALDVTHNNFGLLPTELQKYYVTHLGEKVIQQFERINTELTIQTIHKNDFLDKIISNVTVLKVDNSATAVTSNWDGNMSKLGGGDSYAAIEQQPNICQKNQDTNFSKSGYENHDGPKPSFGREKYLVKAQTYKKISPDNGSNINNWDVSPNGGGKRENALRPILGVGVRLQKSENKKQGQQDDNWRERGGSGDATIATTGDWRETKSELNPTAAGWESKSKSSGGSGWGNDNTKESGKKSWSQHDDRTETDYTNS